MSQRNRFYLRIIGHIIFLGAASALLCQTLLQAQQVREQAKIDQKQAQLVARAKQNLLEAKGLPTVYKIINDPMFSTRVHGSQLILDERKFTDGVLQANYNFVKDKSSDNISSVSFLCDKNDDIDFLIFLTNDDVTDVIKSPDWEKMQPQWDAFVTRYWPGMQRIDNWQTILRNYEPGRGVSSMRYALKEQGIDVMSLSLNVRLADGKIGGLDFVNDSSKMHTEMKGLKMMPPPAKTEMLTALAQILASLKLTYYDHGRTITTSNYTNIHIVEIKRGYSFHKNAEGLVYGYDKLIFNADVSPEKMYVFRATYDEETRKATIDGETSDPMDKPKSQPVSPPGTMPTTNSVVSEAKPYTTVVDSKPAWGDNGQELSFTTTRDVRGRPWWQRQSIVLSSAVYSVSQDKTATPTLVRPIKPLGSDFGGYGLATLSPTGKFLAATQGPRENQLFLLNMKQGLVYLPDRDAQWKAKMFRIIGDTREDALPQLRWEVADILWLPDESGLILSIFMNFPEPNLYLARLPKDKAPQELELTPLVVERGDSILPAVADAGKMLSYAHKIYQRGSAKQPAAEQWQLVVTDFSASTSKTTNPRILALSAKPTSISWDSKSSRWLVVTQQDMLWVHEENKTLQATKVNGLKWGQLALHVNSAAISPDGNRIAVVAQLSQPKIYAKTEAQVLATIFIWDGQSQNVQPLFDPSLNGLPRYTFPSTGSSWAHIKGDVKKFGLVGIDDSTYFDSPVITQPVSTRK